MPDAAQDTLGLFDNTALGWTVETPQAEAQPATPSTEPDAEKARQEAAPLVRGKNFYLEGDRSLTRGWTARARDNIAAIRLSKELAGGGRAPTAEEQAQLLRFTGFGATELAQNCFPLPGGSDFRPSWEAIGRALAEAVSPAEYAALQRATQYAHYTPEPIIRALWRAARHLGFTGGRVLEPGMGTGLFFALIPAELRETTPVTGIEYCPVTARIARLVQPEARIRCEDYTRSRLGGGFDLAIGNRPHRSPRPDDCRPRPAPARLVHRALDRTAAPGRHRALRDQHRHDGQSEPHRARAHRFDGRPDRCRAASRGQHARDRRHRRRDRRPRLSAPRRRSGAKRHALDEFGGNRARQRCQPDIRRRNQTGIR